MPIAPAKTETDERTKRRGEDLAIAFGLVAVTIIAYANSFDGVFVYDDETAIVNNPAVRTLWDPASGKNSERPFAIWTFSLNYAVGGLDPTGYHAVNLLIHAASGVCLWLLARRILATHYFSGSISNNASRLSAIIAVLWLCHPLNTQAVTYVVQRMESLASLFMLVALYAVARSKGKWSAWWLVAGVSAVLGMWTKPIVVTLPILAVLVDRVTSPSAGPHVARRVALCLTLTACVLAPNAKYLLNATRSIRPATTDTVAADSLEVTTSDGELNGFKPPTIAELKQRPSAWEYLRTQPEVLLHYARLVVWPTGLTLDYAWPVQQNLFISFGLGLVILAAVIGSAYLVWSSPGWGLFAIWPWVLLGPTSSFIPIQDLAYEHRMYLALVGPVAGLVLVTFSRARNSFTPTAMLVAAGGVSLAFATLTINRNRDYHSAERIWAATVKTAPWNARAWNNLAFIKLEQGNDEYAAAAFACARQTETTPARRIYILHNEAFARYNLGQYEQTVALADEAEEVAGGVYALPHFLRGSVAYKEGRYAKAVAELDKSAKLEPDFLGTYFIRGQANFMLGNDAAAAQDFETLLQSEPERHEAVVNYALALKRLGRTSDAIAQFSRAIDMQPNDWALYADRGSLLRAQKQYDAAIRDFQTTLQNAPQLSPAWQGLIATLVDAERWAAATQVRSQFERLGGKIPDNIREKLESAQP